MTVYVRFATLLIWKVDAPAMPAVAEVLKGLAKRQHSKADAPFFVTIAVAWRNASSELAGLNIEGKEDRKRAPRNGILSNMLATTLDMVGRKIKRVCP
jgi:hypothetical protein